MIMPMLKSSILVAITAKIIIFALQTMILDVFDRIGGTNVTVVIQKYKLAFIYLKYTSFGIDVWYALELTAWILYSGVLTLM